MKNQFMNIQPSQPNKKPGQDTSTASSDTDTPSSPPVASLKPTSGGLWPPLTNIQKQQLIQNNTYQTPGSANGFAPMQQGPKADLAPNGEGFFPGRLPTTPDLQPRPGGISAGQAQPSSPFVGYNPVSSLPAGPRPPGYTLPNNPMSGPPGSSSFARPNAPGYSSTNLRPTGYNPPSGVANPLSGPGYPPAINPAQMPGEMAYQQRSTPNFGPPPMRAPTPQQGRRTKRRFPIWARVLVTTLAILLILVGSAYGYYQFNYADAINSITGQQAIHHVNIAGSTPAGQANHGGTPTGNRVNILLLGSDDDGKNGNNGVGGAPLAQTDLVITIDPQTNYVGELSIPRDMQVTIPNHNTGKMDFAFSYGYQEEGGTNKTLSTASAAALTEDTITYNYGIHIDYYAWVGLSGFIKVIDTAGGVDIDVLHPIVDDTYPDDVNNPNNNAFDYTRLYMTPGPQHMNGAEALNYVRTRHADLGADFGRTIKQQQLLSQLKTKLATPDTISKTPALLADLKGFLQTDMTPSQIIQMANYARGTDTNKIEHITLSPPTYSQAGLSGGNFAPICNQVRAAITKMFAVKSRCIPQVNLASAPSSSGSIVAMANSALPPQSVVSFASTGRSALDQMTPANMLNGNMAGNSMGVHSLLDLMLMTAFGSFDAARV